MKVKAIAVGYFDDVLRREGETFIITPRVVKVTKNSRYAEKGRYKYGVKYKGKHYDVGSEYTITPEDQFSKLWMEEVTSPKRGASKGEGA